MDKNIQCIILQNGSVLISEIEEAFGEIPGEPDCRLIKPFKLIKTKDVYTLEPWLDYSNQSVTMMRSGDAITFVEPNGELLDKYLKLIS